MTTSDAAKTPGGDLVRVEFDQGVAWVTMNRPDKRNAISPRLAAEMVEVLDALDAAGIAYTLHLYDYDPAAERIGLQAAEGLGVPGHMVVKTLMALVDGKPVLLEGGKIGKPEGWKAPDLLPYVWEGLGHEIHRYLAGVSLEDVVMNRTRPVPAMEVAA